MSNRILVSGCLAYDILLGFDGSFADSLQGTDLSKLSVSYFSPRCARHNGGTSANIAWHIALLGGDPLLTGSVGDDGQPYLHLLAERGIDASSVDHVPGHVTAFAVIATDSGHRQVAFFHPGADAHGKELDVRAAKDDIAWAIVSPRNPVLMLQASEHCAEMDIPTIFDPGQQLAILAADDLRAAIARSTGLIVNEYEWDMLCGRLGCTLRDLLGSMAFVIITRGGDGVQVCEQVDEMHIRACTAETLVNPTGAGDVFRAGLLTGLTRGLPLHAACRLGAGIASFVVEQQGALLHALDRTVLTQRLRAAYGADAPDLL